MRADTEVINGITYEVIYLDGDNTENWNKINSHSYSDRGNYRYVMTADWHITFLNNNPNYSIPGLYGNSVIFDLNGYTLTTVAVSTYSGCLDFRSENAEITDSSAAGTGTIICNNIYALSVNMYNGSVIFTVSGGNFYAPIFICHDAIYNEAYGWTYDVVLRGGNFYGVGNCPLVWEKDGGDYPFTVSPDMVLVKSEQNISIKPYDAYAVSPSDQWCGAYNYAYGVAWEISAKELANLEIPTDKTYYLWGRNQDEWYQLLTAL